jgi:hypothetical protein
LTADVPSSMPTRRLIAGSETAVDSRPGAGVRSRLG